MEGFENLSGAAVPHTGCGRGASLAAASPCSGWAFPEETLFFCGWEAASTKGQLQELRK